MSLTSRFVFYSLLAVALASIVRRDFTTVLNTLRTIDTDVKRTTTTCNQYSNPATGAQFIADVNAQNILTRDIRTAYDQCLNTAASSVTAAQARSIIDYYNTPLEPDFRVTVNCYVSKRAAVNNLRLLLLRQFQFIRGNFTLLHNCLQSKIPPSPTTLRPAASSVINKFNSDLASLLAAYS